MNKQRSKGWLGGAWQGWIIGSWALFAVATTFTSLTATGATEPVVLGNRHFRYAISATGQNLEFVDLGRGKNLLRTGTESRCAQVRVGGRLFPVSRVTRDGEHLALEFEGSGVVARVRTEGTEAGVVLTVEEVRGECDSLRFLDVPLELVGRPEEPFAACALGLNLRVRIDALPALQRDLQASVESKYGTTGAKVAIVAGPMDGMIARLQSMLSQSSELPLCKVAGPWAGESAFAHGSYLFNFGTLTETNVAEWVESVRRVGFTQVDHHGGGSFFRFGDFELDRAKWPEGWGTFSRIVGRLREAGIGSIFHTYAFFIDKKSKYVTPVPDGRLDAFRTFTLVRPVDSAATEIEVEESTAGLSTVTGFFEHNSVLLHVGDELITFSGFSREAPWKLTGLQRGALGTKATAHGTGSRVRHLKECFGLLVPDPESTLFEEIAANHAEVVNRCGFDGLYLDAIDGSSILRGNDACWYWANKFVVEIQKRLKRPVGMEMSAMWHHFWQYRTRWQAWDVPRRGHERFVDIHARSVNGGLLLPLHLGWWELFAFDPPQVEPSYPEVLEHLGARLIGWDAGISLTAGMNRGALSRTPLFARAADILRESEAARVGGRFDVASRAKLRDPERRFVRHRSGEGGFAFREVRPDTRTVVLDEPWSRGWTVTNGFGRQPVRVRIEALISAAPPTNGAGVVLWEGSSEASPGWRRTTAAGVEWVSDPAEGAGGGLAMLVATNAGRVPRHAAWARLEKRFEPTLNAAEAKAVSVEIEGDGSGALLAIRLESPPHLAYGAIADRYVSVDFTGRRRLTLVETESSRWSDYVWNDGKHEYAVYREQIQFGAIESASLWLQNLAPGRRTRIGVGAVTAVPLRTGSLVSPVLVMGGQRWEFPITLTSGSWIEARGPGDCEAYGPKGESLGKIVPRGEWPTLEAGPVEVRFEAGGGDSVVARARVTTYVGGEVLEATGHGSAEERR